MFSAIEFNGASLRSYVRSRGYKVEEIFNSTAAAEGQPLRIMGYAIKGPRNSKGVITRLPSEFFDKNAVSLICDGFDYAAKKRL